MNTNVEHYDYAELVDINPTIMPTLSRGQQTELSREHQERGHEILYEVTMYSQYSPGQTEKHDLINDQHSERARSRWQGEEDRNFPYSSGILV